MQISVQTENFIEHDSGCTYYCKKPVSNKLFISWSDKGTRKHPLGVYNLGVLTHANAVEQHWGGNETLK